METPGLALNPGTITGEQGWVSVLSSVKWAEEQHAFRLLGSECNPPAAGVSVTPWGVLTPLSHSLLLPLPCPLPSGIRPAFLWPQMPQGPTLPQQSIRVSPRDNSLPKKNFPDEMLSTSLHMGLCAKLIPLLLHTWPCTVTHLRAWDTLGGGRMQS